MNRQHLCDVERTVAPQLEALLNESQVSEITGRSVASLRRDRLLGKGCPYVKLGFLVKYRPRDVEAYIAQNLRGTRAER